MRRAESYNAESPFNLTRDTERVLPPRLIVSSARTVAQKWPRACARLLCALAALACLAQAALARDSYARLRWLDALEYRIYLSIPETGDEISGQTTIVFALKSAPPRELPLDFGSLAVEGVTVNGQNANFRRAEEHLFVTLAGAYKVGDPLNVTVKYHGRPVDGLFFKRNKFGDRTVFADNWPNRAHHWFPSIDHPYDKAKVEFTVEAPARYGVVANGRLLDSKAVRDGARVTRWREDVDIPVYCMVVGATDFSVLEAGKFGGTVLSYYLYPKDREKGLHDYGRALRAAEFFTNTVGPYPYEKLALVQSSTRFGGMENSSSIFFDENSYDGSGKLEGTVAHEIAHQWFGDSVTESDWNHLWLSEGFATYFGALFFEHADGRERFLQVMRGASERYMKDADAVPRPIYDPAVTDLFKLLNRNNYEKGAWVLHMLRHVMGDEKFFEGVRDYYKTYRDRNALTEDFQRVMEKHYGRRLDWFFGEWIYKPGFPAYRVRWAWRDHLKQTCVSVDQAQADTVFRTPLDIEFRTGSEVRRETVNPQKREQVFCFHQSNKPQTVSVDPGEWVLKTLTLAEEE
jgi:aminopeptidase N